MRGTNTQCDLSSSFINNTCFGFGAGAVILDYSTNGILAIENSLFDSNINSGPSGGGLYYEVTGTNTQCTISSSSFSNNTAGTNSSLATGGGLDLVFGVNSLGTANGGTAIIEDCQFMNNTTSGNGGGIAMRHNSPSANSYIFRNCHVEGNSADENVGGFLGYKTVNGNLSLDISHSTFSNNTSPQTLALGLSSASGLSTESAKISNCLFSGHTGSSATATIIAQFFAAEITNCTINEESTGIAGLDDADIKLQNNIINTGSYPTAVSLSAGSQFTSLGGNLFSDGLAIGWALAEDQQVTDPLFETGTSQLSSNSPAVDKGVLPQDVPSTDLAGVDRIQGGCIDIGAYESAHDAGAGCLNVGVYEELISATAMEIYPNPVSDVANISLENDWRGTLSLRIVNVLGQTVQSLSVEKNNEFDAWQLNTKQLPKGTYRIMLSNGEQMAVTTFIVIR